jgi:hypothetical protein
VLGTKLRELLGHMLLEHDEEDMKAKKEEIDRWMQFQSMLHSHPMSDSQARKKFMKTIEPKIEDPSSKAFPDKKYETDIELLKRMKASQKGG